MLHAMPRSRFLVVGSQRSGSSVTHTCIVGHPEATGTGDEVRAEPLFTRGIAAFTCGNDTWPERQRGYRALFDALSLRDDDPAIRAHGMKVALASPSEAIDVANTLRDHLPDVRIVLIRRDDLIAQYASLHRAQATGIWHSFHGAASNSKPIAIATGPFLDYARDCRRILAQLRTLRHSHALLEVEYERTVVGGLWHEIFAFLGLTRLPPTWVAMQKVSPPARASVAGYDDLLAALQQLPQADEQQELAAARARAEARLGDDSVLTLVSRAQIALAAGRFDEAERAALAALDRAPQPIGTMRQAAFDALEAAWDGLGSVARALAGLQRLAAAYADDARLAMLRGVVLGFAQRAPEAIAEFERALRLDPGLLRARTLLADWRRSRA